MKVFISHSEQDSALAQKLGGQLGRAGLDVWNPEEHIASGENAAKRTGEAMDDCDMLVILLTPQAMESEPLRRDVEYAIGSRKHAGRVFSVFVGATLEAGKDMPWILLKLPHSIEASGTDFKRTAKAIQRMGAAVASVSHA